MRLVEPYIRTCLPKIICRIDRMSSRAKVRVREDTHYKLSLAGEVPLTNANEGIVVLALAEGRAVDVSREPAYGREDARVKSCLECVSHSSFER